MARVLHMPNQVSNLIDFALTPLGVVPSGSSNEILTYTLHNDTGLTLIVGVACIEQRKHLIFKDTVLRISVFEPTKGTGSKLLHLTQFMPLAQSAHDMHFGITLLSKFTSMTRAVADILDAGECITMGGK